MKICANCGTSVPDDAAFCNNCGSAMTETPASENAGTPAAPAADANAASSQPAPAPAPAPAPQPGFQQYQQVDVHDHTADFDAKDIADNKLFAVLPYFFSFIVGIIAGIYVKDSEFIKFHTKVNIQYAIVSILILLLFIIPIVGWICGSILLLVVFVCKVISIVYVFQGKAKDAPIIGSLGFLKF